MIKYRVRVGKWTTPLPQKVEATKETELSIYLLSNGRERREAKVSQEYRYFDTFAEAHAFCLEKTTEALNQARKDEERWSKLIHELEAMTE